MTRHTLLALAVLALTGSSVAAQDRPPRLTPRGPSTWTTLSVAAVQMEDIYEGGSNSVWQTGTPILFGASLEQMLQNGGAIGVKLGYGSLPMTYSGADCNGCNANARLLQALATFRIGMGGGRVGGLGQVLDFSLGATSVQDITTSQTRTKVGPSTTVAPTASIGYGISYALKTNMQFVLTQEYGMMFFKSGSAASGSQGTRPQTQTTRIGLRIGLGK